MMLRVERKYLVPNDKLKPLRERFSSFVCPDCNGMVNGSRWPQYTVRSIYMDSKDLTCYSEKKEGLMFRRKLRIRGYNQLNEENIVVMEIKRKIQNRQKKYRSFVNYENIEDLIYNGDLEKYIIVNGCKRKSLTDAAKFMFHLKKRQFGPTCLITYEREAYFGKFDQGVRVTFDKNVRSRMYPKFDSLFSEEFLKPVFKKHFVLEIKYFSRQMPLWARSVVQEFKLRNDAISKYTLGIDANQENFLISY